MTQDMIRNHILMHFFQTFFFSNASESVGARLRCDSNHLRTRGLSSRPVFNNETPDSIRDDNRRVLLCLRYV